MYGKIQNLGSLKSFLLYASQLSWASILHFSHPEFLNGHCRAWLQPDGCQIMQVFLSFLSTLRVQEFTFGRLESLMIVASLFTDILGNTSNITCISYQLIHNFLHEKHQVNTENCTQEYTKQTHHVCYKLQPSTPSITTFWLIFKTLHATIRYITNCNSPHNHFCRQASGLFQHKMSLFIVVFMLSLKHLTCVQWYCHFYKYFLMCH